MSTVALLVCLAIAQAAAQPVERTGSVNGITSTDGISTSLDGRVVGGLEGPIQLTLRTVGSRIEGGEWTLTVTRLQADGSTTVAGVLHGTATGGVASTNAGGELVGLNDVELLVREGTDEFANVTAGTGALTVWFDGPESFNASLSLNY